MESLTEAQLLEAIRDKESILAILSRKLFRDLASSAHIYAMKPDETMNENQLANARQNIDKIVAGDREKINETHADIVTLKTQLRKLVAARTTDKINADALARRKLVAEQRAQQPVVASPPVKPPKKIMTGRKWVALPKGGRRRVTRRRRMYRK